LAALPFRTLLLSTCRPSISLHERILKQYPTTPRTLGEHLRKRRLDLNLTQDEVAQMLCVSQPLMQRWESGEVSPPPRRIVGIIGFLGYDPGHSGTQHVKLAITNLFLSRSRHKRSTGSSSGRVVLRL
jgi:DNA-binding XRE family transcriptional regulator